MSENQGNNLFLCEATPSSIDFHLHSIEWARTLLDRSHLMAFVEKITGGTPVVRSVKINLIDF